MLPIVFESTRGTIQYSVRYNFTTSRRPTIYERNSTLTADDPREEAAPLGRRVLVRPEVEPARCGRRRGELGEREPDEHDEDGADGPLIRMIARKPELLGLRIQKGDLHPIQARRRRRWAGRIRS